MSSHRPHARGQIVLICTPRTSRSQARCAATSVPAPRTQMNGMRYFSHFLSERSERRKWKKRAERLLYTRRSARFFQFLVARFARSSKLYNRRSARFLHFLRSLRSLRKCFNTWSLFRQVARPGPRGPPERDGQRHRGDAPRPPGLLDAKADPRAVLHRAFKDDRSLENNGLNPVFRPCRFKNAL